ncbi:LacI family transcriptional regulator [Nocardia speluncae]|uniref:LacI family transcriptional regulator n=1 Tax=Nocardia speluncae TaxID=419477 RepID=A0A846XHY1_9NOCA|nr:LacI family DNA-binding transcriptional regulator [Nocardia speluncae]NKY34203.1 LacI family transcriptional regulator [Nocardia speluncae]
MMRAGARVTLKTIAESLGVSVKTVSRALAGKDSVGEELRARIRAEADRLGYVPNSMARSLVSGAAMTVGMVITHPANPFYASLISAVEERCRANGYSLLLMVTEEDLETEREAAEALLRWGVDGAVATPVQQGAEHWQRLRDSGVPIVLVNRGLEGFDSDFVGVDHERGTYEAVSHLLGTGATSIHLLEEDVPFSSAADRRAGFHRALTEHNIAVQDDTVTLVPPSTDERRALPWDPAAAYRCAQQLVSRLEPGAAVVTGSDYFALGLYRALAEKGIDVPAHVSVIGHGDLPFAAYLQPTLASVRPPADEIGARAAELLLERIQGSTAPPATIYLPPELKIRASAGGDRNEPRGK